MFVTALVVSAFAATADSIPRLAHVDLRRDDRRHELVVTIGPFVVPPTMMPMHHDMDMMMMAQSESLVGRFDWPSAEHFHGVRLAVVDAQGQLLPRRLLHHTYMVNFDRRQLVYSIAERSFSFGEETEDLNIPATVGMPMARGHRMGVIIMWNNETGHAVDDAYVRYTFRLNPRRQFPGPLQVMPFFVDANTTVGAADTFSVAPGGRTVTTEFSVPVDGRLIAASGHLHDHAVMLRLEDVASDRTLLTVHALRDAQGKVHGVSRELPGVWGRGPHLSASRRYRLVLVYDNPTADTLSGTMGMMGGLFVPDKPGAWPALDVNDPAYAEDLRGLLRSMPMTVTPTVPARTM